MLTTSDAARLLTAAQHFAALEGISSALGFGSSLRLDRASRRRLGLDLDRSEVRVASGPGALRALLISLTDHTDARARGLTIARAVARGAPELLWLFLIHVADGPRVLILAPPPGVSGSIPLLDVDAPAPHPSDAETLAALAGAVGAVGATGAAGGSDLMVHHRWRETLGRDSLSRRFYRELAQCVTTLAASASGRADAESRRTIALLHTSRLLFLAFLEVRGWLDADREFLRRHFTQRASERDPFGAHTRLLEPLFFGTLNTRERDRAAAARAFGRVPFLNGGLFTRTPLESRCRSLRFTDDAIGEVIGGLLARYRLTPRESSGTWTDAAVDPEMLGRAFESLMHDGTRQSRGAFYTPPPLIARLSAEAMRTVLTQSGASAEALTSIRVLDPACGSGAFLVHLLETIAELRAAAGDSRPIATLRREVLTHSIFGVDVDPTAIWLCQLRLWLSVVVEEPHADPLRLAPLPNLDRNIREGDALAGEAFESAWTPLGGPLTTLRLRYARASGPRKRTLAKELDRRERAHALARAHAECIRLTAERRELVIAARSGDLFAARRGLAPRERARLEALRINVRRARVLARALRDGAALPFAFATHFSEAAQAGGFDLVIGNPPWVRLHAIPAEQRVALRARFVTLRDAAWRSGAEAAAAGSGFAAQADLSALFTERAVQLTRRGGALALLLPAKLWLALAGGGVRQFLSEHAPPLSVEDLSASSAGFDAVVYPSLLVARRLERGASAPESLLATAHRAKQPLTWEIARDRLALDESRGAPWLLLPREVRDAFDQLARAGIPLASTRLGRPLLGVKSGCNDAFLVGRSEAVRDGLSASLLRPVLRGEDVTQWRRRDEAHDSRIIWTHDSTGVAFAELPAAAWRHLAPWRRQLELRSDARGSRWWSLFRTAAARHDCARVVWGDIGRAPRALVLEKGDPTVPLNTCYVVRAPSSDDAHALVALLNTPVAAAWLSVLAEPARGGYRRFLGWTCARFPLPARWEEACALLAPVGRAAAEGQTPDAGTLTELALRAYGLRHAEIAALLSWHAL